MFSTRFAIVCYRRAILVVALCAFASAAHTQTLAQVKTYMAAHDYANAATAAQSVLSSGAAGEKPEAAVLLLRAYCRALNHRAVEDNYLACKQAGSGTQFEAECTYERTYSLYKNAHKFDRAYNDFGTLAASQPASVYAASGAAYQRAVIEFEKLGMQSDAATHLENLTTTWPDSPWKAKALFMLLRVAIGNRDPVAIEAAHQRFISHNPEGDLVPAAELLRADFDNDTAGDIRAAHLRYNSIIKRWPDSVEATISRLRIADLALAGDFERSIKLYEQVIRELPQKNKYRYLRNYTQLQLGIAHFQLGQTEQAQAAFQQLLSAQPGLALTPRAQSALHAIQDPASADGLIALYERGLRWRRTGIRRDSCWQAFTEFKRRAANERAFETYCTDPNIPVEQRAQMRYRLALVYFELGYHLDMGPIIQPILQLLPAPRTDNTRSVTRSLTLYMEAYHHAHCGHYGMAIQAFRDLIEEDKTNVAVVPVVYNALAKAQEMSGDILGATLTLEEFAVLYPYRTEAKQMTMRQARLLTDNPMAAALFPENRRTLIAKIKHPNRALALDEPLPMSLTHEVAQLVEVN